MKKKPQKYKLATSTAWMEADSSNFSASFLKLPSGVSIYQLKVGKSLLDIVPYVTGKGNPRADKGMLYWERIFFVHRGIGPNQNTYICPARTAEKHCPICEDRARILRDDPDDAEFKVAKSLAPKEWQIVQLLDRNAKDKGIQILPLSYFRFGEAIKDAAAAGDEGDNWDLFWHPENGKSLRVQWAEDSMGSTKFIRAKTVIFKDREDLDPELIDSGFCLDDLLIIHDYKTLKGIYTSATPAGKDNDDDDDDDEDENEKPVKKKKKPANRTDDHLDDNDEDDDGDEDEEDKAPKARSKSSKKSSKSESDDEDDEDEDDDSEPEDEEDESEDDEEDDSDDDTESEDDDSEDEDDDSEDEDDEDEEEAPPKKSAKSSSSRKSQTSSRKDTEDDDDDDEDGDEDDDDEDDEDVETTPRGGKFRKATDKDVKRAKKSKSAREEDESEDDDDWDDFDAKDEEDEDDAPRKKKKKR